MPVEWERRKDPDEVLDYKINWADEPGMGADTIVSSSWIVPAGITKDSDSFGSTSTTIWLSGGTDGETYEIVNRVTTAGGRIFDLTGKLKVRTR